MTIATHRLVASTPWRGLEAGHPVAPCPGRRDLVDLLALSGARRIGASGWMRPGPIAWTDLPVARAARTSGTLASHAFRNRGRRSSSARAPSRPAAARYGAGRAAEEHERCSQA